MLPPVVVGGLIRGIEPDADPPWREFKGSAPSRRMLVSRVMIAVCAWYCGLLRERRMAQYR